MSKWTTEKIEMLRDLYPFLPTEEVAQKLGNSRGSVEVFAHRLGLQKDPTRLREAARENVRHRKDR